MSNITAVAYYSGIPPTNKNPEKPLILDNFLQGVKASGDHAIAHTGMNAVPCDVALIQGFVHEHGKSAPHLQLRQHAVTLQKENNRRSLIVDSNLFLYADPNNTKTYLRYSFDGVFPTTGFYFDRNVDPARWQKISDDLGIWLKPWRTQGEHILICLQRHGGWSMGGLDVRTHPGDKKIKSILKIYGKGVRLSVNERLVDDLKGAWATVVYNSSPSVASAIEGVPVFITDPISQHSQAYEIANTDLGKLENPDMPERKTWIERVSMCHWNFNELRSGEAWKFFKQYI